MALTVLGMLIASLEAARGLGLAAWRANGLALDRAGDLDAVDRTLREMIGAMAPARGRGATPITADPRELAFRTVLEGVSIGPPGHELDVGLGTTGQRFVARVRRVYTSLGGPPPIVETTLATGVREVDFQYWDARRGAWDAAWRGDGLPALIRVRITFADPARRWPDIVVAPRRQAEVA